MQNNNPQNSEVMKQIILLAVSCILLSASTAAAQSENSEPFQVGNLWFSVISGTDVETVKNRSESTNIEGHLIIPSSIEYNGVRYNVTRIGNDSFSDNLGITTVTISEGVKEIGYNAFLRCQNLKHANFPYSLTTMGSACFAMTGLEKLDIQSDNILELPVHAFMACDKLTEVTLVNKIEKISAYAFQGCRNLNHVEFPYNLKTIGREAFFGCERLNNVEFSPNLVDIGSSAFQDCKSLSLLVIKGKGLECIREFAFSGCTSLKSITIPESCIAIMEGAFNDIPLKAISFLGSSLPTLSFEKSFGGVDPASVSIAILNEELIPLGGGRFINAFPELFENKTRTSISFPHDLKHPYLTFIPSEIKEPGAHIKGNMSLFTPIDTQISIISPCYEGGAGFKLLFNGNELQNEILKADVIPGFFNSSTFTPVDIPESELKMEYTESGLKEMTEATTNTVKKIYRLDGSEIRVADQNELPSGIYIIRKGNETTKLIIK